VPAHYVTLSAGLDRGFGSWRVNAPYEVVRRIGQGVASEVLVTFKDTFFTRFATVAEQEAGDRVFGDTDWRRVAELDAGTKKPFLVSEYRRRRNVAGFAHTLPSK
jgi:hypothetical protein